MSHRLKRINKIKRTHTNNCEECFTSAIEQYEFSNKEKSVEHLENLIETQPNDARAYNNLVEKHLQTQQYNKALKIMLLYAKNISVAPAINRICSIHLLAQQNGNTELNKQIDTIFENTKQIRHGIASYLYDNGYYEEACKQLETLIKKQQCDYSTISFLGTIYAQMGEMELFEMCFNISKENSKQTRKLIFTHGLTSIEKYGTKNILFLTEYEKGLESGDRLPPQTDIPYLDIEKIHNSRLLVIKEQGIGDEIRFAQHIHSITKYTKSCEIKVSSKLTNLFKQSFPNATISAYNSTEKYASDEYDFYCLMGSLRYYDFIINSDKQTYPSKFLYVDNEKSYFWEKRINTLAKNNFKIAICWKSGKTSGRRYREYPFLDSFIPLFEIKGISFFNATYVKDSQAEIEKLYQETGFIVHNFPELDQKDDLDSTAAYLSNMDLVISVGTAVDELSAAVGTTVIKIANFASSDKCELKKHGYDLPNTYRLEKKYNQDWTVIFDKLKLILEEYKDTGKIPRIRHES